VAEKAIFLTEDDRDILAEVIADFRTRPRNTRNPGQQVTVSGAPGVYIAKLPSGGIPARVNTLVGNAVCEIYSTDITTPSTPSLVAISGYTLTVHNTYPVAHYGTGSPYVRVWRSKAGAWVAEKPPYSYKCTLATTCSLNSTCTVNIYLNGASTSNTLTAWLNWMANTLVASGKEALVQYFEDEGKWVFTNVKC
jgi:hypothetical protein